MFNALNGLGGTGQVNNDVAVSSASNSALYATFAVVGFFAGTVTNALGIRIALAFGGLGYCVYIGAFLCFNHTRNFGYVVFSGVLLGACAGVLWSAQGAIMMSYPPERLKGRYIAWFWIIFNSGAVIGSLVSRKPGSMPKRDGADYPSGRSGPQCPPGAQRHSQRRHLYWHYDPRLSWSMSSTDPRQRQRRRTS